MTLLITSNLSPYDQQLLSSKSKDILLSDKIIHMKITFEMISKSIFDLENNAIVCTRKCLVSRMYLTAMKNSPFL